MEQEQEQQEEVITTTPTEETKEEEVQPTKSVKNFWERLDEVFTQNTELRERMEELVEQFPSEQRVNQEYKSFIFQPERIAISSNDDINQSVQVANVSFTNGGHQQSETFSSFRIRLQRSLVNVKSIQLLSAVVPNATQNIPDNQVIFFYYKIRTVALATRGAWSSLTAYIAGDIVTYLFNTFVCMNANINNQPVGGQPGFWLQITLPANTASPNYYDINSDHLETVYLPPTFVSPPEEAPVNQQNAYNRTFQDYGDLVSALNTAAQYYASILNDVSFVFNQQQNKIQFVPNNIAAGYFYLPAGYEDPNLAIAANGLVNLYPGIFTPSYTLNLRLGYTWNGLFPNPFSFTNIWFQNKFANILYYYLRPYDPNLNIALEWQQDIVTFNSYGDLVNTSCVRLYCDVSLASTEDSSNQQGLLSIVPVNTTNLGVGFYQNNFSNPLTKIPKIISEIGIRLVNDQGLPYLLPNSATVLLELAITYH